MFEDTLELAENKLLLLYIFNKIKIPVSNNKITQIVLENNLINYFTLQEYLSELVSSNFLKYAKENKKHRLIMTKKGYKVLNLFGNRISNNKIFQVDNYFKKQLNTIKQEISVTADYTIENKNNFIVNLKAIENNYTLIDLKLSVGSNKQARNLCAKWKKKSDKLYHDIIKILIND